MYKWQSILVTPNNTLLETMQIIDQTSLQFAVVVDKENHLLGTVTDGDIRRSILRGEGIHVEIEQVMNSTPFVEKVGKAYYEYYRLMKYKNLKQLPIVNEENQIIDIVFLDILTQNNNENTVVLMVGGLGTRLRPLTNEIPKPMLKVGGKPILETIIEGFKQYGYTNIILSVNYKKEVIQDYFQDGQAFGVSISYIEENKQMGTAGALSLIPKKLMNSIIVMNGDLLTEVNFEQLMQFHKEHNAMATMCVREYEYQIPYGIIETKEANLISIKEKPKNKNFVNAGIYVLNPKVLDFIPHNDFYDMPDLFEKLMDAGENVLAFPIHEYWLDIGRMDDFERANNDYKPNDNMSIT